MAVERCHGDQGNAPVPFEEVPVARLLSRLTRLRDPDESDWLLQVKRPGKPY